MLDIRHLEAFQALERTTTLTSAARTLHCTQSALSHLVADLERQFGIALLARDRRPLALTAAGRRIADCAKAVLPLLGGAADDIARMKQGTTGRLLISLECHSCFEWLVPTLDAYRGKHPTVDLDLRIGASFAPLPALLDGVVDLLITSERSAAPGVSSDPLFRYEIVAVLPATHALSGRKRLEPADFAHETVITYPVDDARLDLFTRFLQPARVVPAKRRSAELTAMIVQLVASGHGIAALPAWAVSAQDTKAVVTRPLGRTGLWSDLFALRRLEQKGTNYIDAFIGLAKATCFKTLTGVKSI
jgi:LysR family transcriptional regulator, regulator for metE and metH